MGLLITPGGFRSPFRRCDDTTEHCKPKGLAYRTQTELAAERIGERPRPPGTAVVVVGDAAADAGTIRVACAGRNLTRSGPINPARVLAGAEPRPEVRLLADELTARPFHAIRLDPNPGTAAVRRRSRYRGGPKIKPRIASAHSEDPGGRSAGNVRLVFSTRENPTAAERPDVQKILPTTDRTSSQADVVEWYDLRWQIEPCVKEVKGTLGFARYRVRRFDKGAGWLGMTLVTFLDLEWYRARRLTRSRLSKEETERWRHHRTYGLCLAVRREPGRADLGYLADALQAEGGIRRLRRQLAAAAQTEYRMAL